MVSVLESFLPQLTAFTPRKSVDVYLCCVVDIGVGYDEILVSVRDNVALGDGSGREEENWTFSPLLVLTVYEGLSGPNCTNERRAASLRVFHKVVCTT